MDSALWDQINTLLADALDQPEDARDAYVQEHATDERVLAEARELLAAHAAAEADDALASPFTDAPVPETIGPWRPTMRLGAGGMGVVYAAERIDASFRQRAALKLVRPGFGPDFRDRFLRERRLLASLDHPGIARLLDGGLTEDGLPYLAMELVEGEAITTYARTNELTIRDRLGLFLQACEAIAHAHRHLVVHRDLKPAHILVGASEQGAQRVKLLDFGIAKLLDANEEDALTRTTGGPMTPQYAAPEQITGGPVTTATDVYSLGVVLYELLTGQRPYDLAGLSASEAEHVVTGVTPTRPSATTETVTDTRHLRGDLDTMVMKALAKEPERRYASAEAFADDLQRYLDGLPVRARPDTWRYRAAKFTRRHRVAIAAGSVALAAIVGGAGAALWQANEARAEAAQSDALNTFLLGMLRAADPTEDGRDVRVASLLDRAAEDADSIFADQPDIEGAVRHTLGVTYRELGLYDEAHDQLQLALRLRTRALGGGHRDVVETQNDLAWLYTLQDDLDTADSLLSAALPAVQALREQDFALSASVLSTLGYIRYRTGDLAGSAEAHLNAVRVHEGATNTDPVELAAALGNVAIVLADQGKLDEAAAQMERQVEVYRGALEPGNTRIGRALTNLSSVYYDAARLDEALAASTEAVELFRNATGEDNSEYGWALGGMGSVLTDLERYDDAVAAFTESLQVYEQTLGPEHTRTSSARIRLGRALSEQGRHVAAEPHLRQALATLRETVPDDHPVLGNALDGLGRLLIDTDRSREAVPMMREALAIREQGLPEGHLDRARSQINLGHALLNAGAASDATPLIQTGARALRAQLGEQDPEFRRAQALLNRSRA